MGELNVSKEPGVSNGNHAGSSLVFNGISSLDQKTDSTVRVNWPSHPSAIAYEIYQTSPTSSYLATVSFTETAFIITGLTPGSTYSFLVRAKDSQGLLDANTTTLSATMNAAPDEPSSLALIIPSVSPGVSATPTIRVTGVKNGDTVKLFTDNTCLSEVASGIATSSTINLTTSPLAPGTHTFYARSINSIPTVSTCSSSSVSYVKSSCPTGYIPVPANSTLGSPSEFCVMKYEAKNVSSVATSQASLSPWTFIDASTARTACVSLGSNYDIISNPEWMTIAYEIEKTAANWSGGSPGLGSLSKGHTDNFPNSAIEVADTSDTYNGTGNTSSQAMGSGGEQKRSQTLSNGETIWDFTGNVGEWVDWMKGGNFDPGPTSCLAVNTEYKDVSCAALAAIDYMPGNPAGISATTYTNTAHGIGQFHGGTSGYAIRGGGFDLGLQSGIFDLELAVPGNNTASDIGFRCVYRP